MWPKRTSSGLLEGVWTRNGVQKSSPSRSRSGTLRISEYRTLCGSSDSGRPKYSTPMSRVTILRSRDAAMLAPKRPVRVHTRGRDHGEMAVGAIAERPPPLGNAADVDVRRQHADHDAVRVGGFRVEDGSSPITSSAATWLRAGSSRLAGMGAGGRMPTSRSYRTA